MLRNLTNFYNSVRMVSRKNKFLFELSVEILFVYLLFTIISVSIIFQIDNAPIFDLFIIKIDDVDNFFFVVFQIQATVATLAIAEIALLSGLITTKHYGISITNYIMNIKPRILKHKLLISMNLISIIFNYYFCSLRLYDIVTAIFICSILLCLRMIADIYTAFSYGTDFKKEISEYIQMIIRQDYFTIKEQQKIQIIKYNLQNDMHCAIQSNDYAKVCDDIKLIDIIIDYTFGLCYRNIDHEIFIAPSQNFVQECKTAINDLLYSYNERYICIYIESLTKIYINCTSYQLHTDILGDISKKLFNVLSIIDPMPVFNTGSLSELRISVYNNMIEEFDTWDEIEEFLPSLYRAFLFNKYYTQLNLSTKQKIWEDLVIRDTVQKTDYCPKTKTRFLTEPRKIELNNLFHLIIDQNDLDILSAIFPLSHGYMDVDLSITAYIYNAFNSISINSAQREKYKSILFDNGKEFYFNLIARNTPTLVNNCKNIVFYITGRKDSYDSPRVGSLDFHVIEFLFYYILFHIFRICKNDITETINMIFENDRENLFNCFYFKGNAKKFLARYNKFCDSILGNCNLKNEAHYSDILTYCRQYFDGYPEDAMLGK